MHKELEQAEESGRGGDRFLGHLSPGDVVIPRGMMKEEWREFLRNHFDVDTYTVGHKKNSLNPITGLPEFMDAAGQDNGDKGGATGGMNEGGFDGTEGGADGFSPGAAGKVGGWAGFTQALGDFFGNSSPVQGGTMDQMGTGGGVDATQMNPLQQAAQQVAPVNYGASVPELNMPMSPDVPDSLPQIGQYYSTLAQGNPTAAQNMMERFMRGDSNVYGR